MNGIYPAPPRSQWEGGPGRTYKPRTKGSYKLVAQLTNMKGAEGFLGEEELSRIVIMMDLWWVRHEHQGTH